LTAFERPSRAEPTSYATNACYQYLHAGGLDVVDMHKNIGAAVIGRDKALSAIRRRVLQEQLRSWFGGKSMSLCPTSDIGGRPP
jgi:hypothetical protein